MNISTQPYPARALLKPTLVMGPVIIMMMTALASAFANAQIIPLTHCTRLTKSGVYGWGGLHPQITATGNGVCMMIDGPNIVLTNGTGGGGGAVLQGNGSGVGVWFTRRAIGGGISIRAGAMGISGFDIGILIEGKGVQLPIHNQDGMIIGDSTIGIELRNARRVVLGCPTCDPIVRDGAFLINGPGIGVLVTGSSVNDVISGTANQESDGLEIPPIGIQVGRGSSRITIIGNSTDGAMIDLNRKCGTDTWQDNTFTSANRSCIH